MTIYARRIPVSPLSKYLCIWSRVPNELSSHICDKQPRDKSQLHFPQFHRVPKVDLDLHFDKLHLRCQIRNSRHFLSYRLLLCRRLGGWASWLNRACTPDDSSALLMAFFGPNARQEAADEFEKVRAL